MRRRNRKWVAIAVGLYLLILFSAARWSIHQRPSDGNIFTGIERNGIRRLAEERAKAAAAAPKPTGETRLNAAGPAFVAARYDQTHVVFMVSTDTESRFSTSRIHFANTPTRISAPARSSAPLAGMQELYEPDAQSLHFLPKIVQETQPGERWTLSVSADTSVPVVIERPVIAAIGCSLALGFLAAVPSEQQSAVDASSQEYFAVRHTAVESIDPPANSHIAELPDWKPSATTTKQIEQQLNERMKQEAAKIDARLLANAGTPGASSDFPVGGARPRLKEWIRADQGLTRGEGALDYDLRAFRLTPDGAPRVFVRARWKLADATVFLMTAWFKAEMFKAETLKAEMPKAQILKAEPPKAAALKSVSLKPAAPSPDPQITLLSSDASWSTALREGDPTGSLGDTLDFQTILNEFDADHDGWAELLVYSREARSYDAHASLNASTAITLFLYTDKGLVPMKTPLRRDAQPPESCVDP